jgi:branched-chain amino acid transport system ATP-binding protein
MKTSKKVPVERVLLEIDELSVYYGGIHALKGISLRVPQGNIITLIGSNGAGKSTTLRAICGLVEARRGRIRFRDREIQNRPAHRIVREGVVMVPEGRRIFPNLSVEENLLMGGYYRRKRAETWTALDHVYELFPRLSERKRQKGGTLSGGEQQMLALGRGMMSRPDLLMLDEPSLGLAPKLVGEVFRIIRDIHGEGTTILLIEQNAKAALGAAAYGYVLQSGQMSMQGTGAELSGNPMVREAYLGENVK